MFIINPSDGRNNSRVSGEQVDLYNIIMICTLTCIKFISTVETDMTLFTLSVLVYMHNCFVKSIQCQAIHSMITKYITILRIA